MAKAKTPDQWTPAYRNRMEKAFAKNPYATKTEARRGANSKEAIAEHKGSKKDWDQRFEAKIKAGQSTSDLVQQRDQLNIKAKLSNVKLREELGVLSPTEAKKASTLLKQMGKDIKDKYETVVAGSSKDHELTEKIKQEYAELRDGYGLIGDVSEDDYGEIWYQGND